MRIIATETKLTLAPIDNIPWGGNITLRGKLTKISGEPLDGKEIRLSRTNAPVDWNTAPLPTFTRDGGNYNVIITTKKSFSTSTPFDIVLRFPGDDEYSESWSNEQTFFILPHSTISILENVQDMIATGEPITFTAILKDTYYNVPMDDREIHFNGSGVLPIGHNPSSPIFEYQTTVKTDENGKASFSGEVPAVAGLKYEYQAHFYARGRDDPYYKPAHSQIKNYSATPTMFGGRDFFQLIRTNMDNNSAMAIGVDNGLTYVVFDALFYSMEIFLRDDTKTFTETASSVSWNIRVVTNGSFTHEYNLLPPPARVPWEGEIIIDYTTPRPGVPASMPDHYFIGRENALPIRRHHSDKGDPSRYSSNTRLRYAMGGLLPLIQKRFKAVPHNGPIGPDEFPSPSMTDWYSRDISTGKVGYGLHQSSGCFFIFCQQDNTLPGLKIKTIIDRMAEAAVDDAVLGDGSTSTCLFIDGKFAAKPSDLAEVKDRSITTGLMFRKRPISIRKGIVNITHSTDPNFNSRLRPPIILSDPIIEITAGPKGLVGEFSSLGRIIPFSITEREILNLMGITTIPFEISSFDSDLTHGTTFTGSPNDKVTVNLQMNLTTETSGADSLRGNIKIENGRGRISGNITLLI